MEKFTVYTGTTVPLMNDNIDTDQILPKQFLKLIDKKGFGAKTHLCSPAMAAAAAIAGRFVDVRQMPKVQ